MQVVAVQLDIVWEDKSANHAKLRELLAATTIQRDALIVVPEMFDTGFSMNTSVTAQSAARESEQCLRALAIEYRAAVFGGVVGPIVDGQATNESVCFGPDGTELVRYRKMQPFTPIGEDQAYGAGDQHRIFTWGGCQVAPQICYDLRFPENFRAAAREGAELFVVIACWPSARTEHWVRLLQARAIENQAFVVGVNRCGSDPSFSYDGHSVVFDPLGNSLFQADQREQVFSVGIDIEQARDWREKFPALRDMRG